MKMKLHFSAFFVVGCLFATTISGTVFGQQNISLQPGASITIEPEVATTITCKRETGPGPAYARVCRYENYSWWHVLIKVSNDAIFDYLGSYSSLEGCREAHRTYGNDFVQN
jgi:hypothetical protein